MSRKRPKLTKVSLSLPFGIGKAEWSLSDTERTAAWCLYVELVTRIAVQPLELDQGLAREALTSLHSLFASTRETLKQYGPDLGASEKSIGGIAIAVLNRGVRPFLSKWHPLLLAWEVSRPASRSHKDHELKWKQEARLRGELEILRKDLAKYAKALGEMAGVKS